MAFRNKHHSQNNLISHFQDYGYTHVEGKSVPSLIDTT